MAVEAVGPFIEVASVQNRAQKIVLNIVPPQFYETYLQTTDEEKLGIVADYLFQNDPETSDHSQRVSQLATQLAVTLGFSINEIIAARQAGYLHDIGKLDSTIARTIAYPRALFEAEKTVVAQHASIGAEVTRMLGFSENVVQAVGLHHTLYADRYPKNLSHLDYTVTDIIPIVDVYDALCSERVYKKSWCSDDINSTLQEMFKNGKFPPGLEYFFLLMTHTYDDIMTDEPQVAENC